MNDVVVVENAVRQGIFEVGVGDDRGWHLKDVLGYRGGAACDVGNSAGCDSAGGL